VSTDMAMEHPISGIRVVQQDLGPFSRAQEDRVFPLKVGIRSAIGRKHQEALAVKVYGMLHRMHGVRIVEQFNFGDAPLFELPIDVHVLGTGSSIHQLPNGI